MVEIEECDNGYQVRGRGFEHTFSDRPKALLVAQLVALKQATDEGHDVRIVVPATWGNEAMVENCLFECDTSSQSVVAPARSK